MQKNKKSEIIQNHNRILKPKYTEIKNTSKVGNGKIMLTDLCPQQKAKIGQLIKTLQQRKSQNQILQQQIGTWRSNFISLQKIKTELQKLIQSKDVQIKKLVNQIEVLNKQTIQKDIQLEQKSIELSRQLKKVKHDVQKINFGMNTVSIEKASQQSQTKQKKRKQKSKQIQVNGLFQFSGFQHRETKKNNFYQPNSKSFERIMNGQKNESSYKRQDYETAVFKQEQQQYENFIERQDAKDGKKSKRQASNIQYSNNQKALKAEQLLDYKNWSQYGEQSDQNRKKYMKKDDQDIQIQDTQNDDDEFETLAKKWLQLKEKNIQQMTEGYFIEQKSENTNLKSLGLNSKLQKGKEKQQKNNQDEIDELQLNKALKSRDFSASRLLNSKSKRKISENSDKKSLQNSSASYRNTQNNIKKPLVLVPQRKNPPKVKYFNDENGKGVDFYSNDLLDLVEQINK